MKTLTLALMAVWLSFAQNLAKAQSPAAKISGVVLDAANKPVDGATVILLSAKDSATVKTTLGNADGSFVLDNLKANSYRLVVTLLGYQSYKSGTINLSEQQTLKLPAITLMAASKTLKEVSVTAQKQLIEQKIDRTVVNVNALISNVGSNALEVLEKAPGVVVDDNGNISFKGKNGVMVMIDDKPTYLSGEALANYLKSIPASQLDQVELMSDPPAKYDASGNAGIINIKTKRSKEQGFNGTLSANAGRARYWRSGESLNINYHVGNINIFANLGYNIQNSYRRLDVGRTYLNAAGNVTSSYTEEAYFYPKTYTPNARIGLDYFLSPKTTIGFILSGTFTTNNNFNPVNSVIRNGAGGIDSNIVAANSTGSFFNNKGINMNYSHQYDKKGRELSFNIDYLNYTSGRDQTFLNSSYNAAGILAASQHITADLPAMLNIYAAKADYAHPLSNKAKLETGLKASYVSTDNSANYFNVANNISTVDNNTSNHFIYKENINAAYISFSKEYKRLSLQAGLRLENTNITGHQLGNAQSPDSAFTQHYTNLFPTAYLLYKLDTVGSNTLKLAYGRRIDRPYYQDLNPFITILDKYSQWEGNPFLRPQFAHEFELTYAYKSLFSIGIDHNIVNDYRVEYDFQKGNIFSATTMNLGQRIHWALEFYMALNPVKWWNFTLNTELDHNNYVGQLATLNVNTTTTYLYLNYINQFNLSHGWNSEVSLFYLSPSTDSQFTHIYRQQVNVALAKKLFGDKVTVRLSARDIFRGNFSAGNITNIPNVLATYHNDNANRMVILGFTYNFGTAAKNTKKHTNSAQSEQDRVGN